MNKVVRHNTSGKIVKSVLSGLTILSLVIVVLIIWQIGTIGIKPFVQGDVKVHEFLVGTSYNVNNYQIGFIIVNTIYVVGLSIILSVPVSVLTALFIARIASRKISLFLTTIVEITAAIPSIIFGLFGSGFITKVVQVIGVFIGVKTYGGLSVLSSVLVLSMMIFPTITMVSITAIKSVPKAMEEGSLALGVSPIKTYFSVTLKAAVPGIFAGIILGVGRALGEATAVSMVTGNIASGPSLGFFDPTRTLTSTILLGIKETTGLDYEIRFSVGLVLILIIILVNFVLNSIRKSITKKYDY